MPRRFVDLSVPLEADIASDPPIMLPEIEYFDHQQTAPQMAAFFPGLKTEDLPGGDGWALEKLTIYTHNGTHLDAPYHHHSTMDGGKRAITIDEVPLEWCYGNGVKLDFRHLPDGHVVTPDEVDAELARIGHVVQPMDIVVINTSAGARYGEPDYLHRGCGMGRAATLHLLRQGVRVTGTDAWSWDAPFSLTAERYAETGDADLIWEGHRASMEIGYCHIEKLANLDLVPATGFVISCFPFKIKAASAGFVRAWPSSKRRPHDRQSTKEPLEVVFTCAGHATGKMRNDLDVSMVSPFLEEFALATDEGPFHGGDATAPPPLALFIGGLTGCIMTQLRAFAKRMDVQIDDLHVDCRIAWQWTPQGRIYETAPKSFDIDIRLDSPNSLKEQIALIEAAKKGCFVEQTLGQVNTVSHKLKTEDGYVDVENMSRA